MEKLLLLSSALTFLQMMKVLRREVKFVYKKFAGSPCANYSQFLTTQYFSEKINE